MPAPTNIDKNANKIELNRPHWVTDESDWQRILAFMVDVWNDTLEDEAKRLASRQRESGTA